MTDRERLIEIVKNSLIKHIDKSCNLAENIVDDLLSENVTFPPVAFSDNRRERMIELLNGYYEETGLACVHYFTDEESEMLADYILADGWIKPPCKVDDTLYYIPFGKNIKNCIVHAIELTKKEIVIKCSLWTNEREGLLHKHLVYFNLDDFGKTVFLTREEAEKAIKNKS